MIANLARQFQVRATFRRKILEYEETIKILQSPSPFLVKFGLLQYPFKAEGTWLLLTALEPERCAKRTNNGAVVVVIVERVRKPDNAWSKGDVVIYVVAVENFG